MKPIVAAPIVALALAGAGTGAYFWATSEGGGDEVIVAQPTPNAVATVSPTSLPTSTATPEPDAATSWPLYADPEGLFTVRYPTSWFEEEGRFFSRNPASFQGVAGRPPDAVVVEMNYHAEDGSSGCGVALQIDPQTRRGAPAPDATPTSLDGVPAWRVVRLQGDPVIQEDLTSVEAVSLLHQGYCFNLAAYFTVADPDENIFSQIIGTFGFRK